MGHILLNNMLPCLKSYISIIDFKSIQDIKYRNLLENQYRSILSNEETIIHKAGKIYKNVVVNEIEIYKKYCCNFQRLEEVYKNYEK